MASNDRAHAPASPATEGPGEFADFVRHRQQSLVRFAYLLTGNAAEAEDLVQSALLKVYRRWGSLHGNPNAYVRTAIINEHNSLWRRPWRRNELANSDLVTLHDPVARADRPDDGDLRARIAALPKQQRAAIILRYYEDMTEAQTAQILGCSVGAVKSHTSRALASLRVAMKDDAT